MAGSSKFIVRGLMEPTINIPGQERGMSRIMGLISGLFGQISCLEVKSKSDE